MAFCRKCGKEIDDEAVICPHCGVLQQNSPVYHNTSSSSNSQNTAAVNFISSSDGKASTSFLVFVAIAFIILGLMGLPVMPKGLILSVPCLGGAAAIIASLVKRKKQERQLATDMSKAAAEHSAPIAQTAAAPAKKSNAQAIIGVIAVVILALGFASYYFNIFGPKGEELAIKCYNEYTQETLESKKNSPMKFSFSSPKVLSNTKNIYYIYAVLTTEFAGHTEKTGGLTVLRIDSEAKGRYTILNEYSIVNVEDSEKEPSQEQIQKGLEAAKMIWDSKASD